VVFVGDWIPTIYWPAGLACAWTAAATDPQSTRAFAPQLLGCSPSATCCTGAESAAVAALSGRHAASAIRSWLTGRCLAGHFTGTDQAIPPLRWVVLAAITSTEGLPHGNG